MYADVFCCIASTGDIEDCLTCRYSMKYWLGLIANGIATCIWVALTNDIHEGLLCAHVTFSKPGMGC